MCSTFTAGDVGKQVETERGEPIGSVRMTEAETAHVDVNEDAASATVPFLEADADEGIVPIDKRAVSEITDDAIRLVDGPNDHGADPVIERDETTADRPVSDEQRTLGTQPGAPDDPASSEEGWTGRVSSPRRKG